MESREKFKEIMILSFAFSANSPGDRIMKNIFF